VVESTLCSGLREIEEHWSLSDLMQAHLALDLRDELEAAQYAAAEKRNK
jgi:hypothetical protein